MNGARRSFGPEPWIVAPILLVWLAASILILIGRGDVESLLASAFGRRAQPDAFQFLNRTIPVFWASHSVLTGLAFAAARCRRADILLILLIGPGIALLICIAFEQWSDPNWHDVISICSIGCLVGTLVTGGYWLFNRAGRPAGRLV